MIGPTPSSPREGCSRAHQDFVKTPARAERNPLRTPARRVEHRRRAARALDSVPSGVDAAHADARRDSPESGAGVKSRHSGGGRGLSARAPLSSGSRSVDRAPHSRARPAPRAAAARRMILRSSRGSGRRCARPASCLTISVKAGTAHRPHPSATATTPSSSAALESERHRQEQGRSDHRPPTSLGAASSILSATRHSPSY
jgi:hypothetical protein